MGIINNDKNTMQMLKAFHVHYLCNLQFVSYFLQIAEDEVMLTELQHT